LLQQRQSLSSCFSVQNNIQTLKSTYQPDLYIYNQEPLPFDHSSKESLSSEDESCDNIVNFKGKKNATSTTTTNNYSARNDTLEPPSVRRQSLPGAVWIDGPHLNTSTVMTTDEYDASEEPQGLAVATLVQEPLTVPAKLVVPLSVKYRRWLLVFMVGVVLVTCIILAITLKNVSRNNQLKHIAFQISNQTNYNSLGAPQREAIKWLLGKNNTNLDPKKDQSQLAQRYQLATLYFSTSGGNWSNTISNPNVLSSENECTWDPQWISCSDDRKVVTIKIENNQLQGSIPSEIGNFNKLQILSFRNNRIRGTLPSELGRLKNLQVLNLNSNSLSGRISAEFGKLTNNLTKLDLGNNELSGPIPNELGNWRQLKILELYNNQLSGTIPTELGNLSKLRNVTFQHNQFDGTIPMELSHLTHLTCLDLGNNKLSGSLSSELGRLTQMTELYVAGNALSGTVPLALDSLDNLISIQLSGNDNLSGDLSFLCENSNRTVGMDSTAMTNVSCSCCFENANQ